MSEMPEEIVKLEQWINENCYEIEGPSVAVCYNYLHTTPEGGIISAMQVSGEKKRIVCSKRMIRECFGEKAGSTIGMYIRSTSDRPPKGEDIRNSHMPPEDMLSIVDIPTLSEIAGTCGIIRR